MERLIVYETDKGNYAVRPEQWAGIIDKNGRIKECGLNHTAIFHYKKDAEWYADAKNAEEQGLLLRLPAPLDDVESFEIADKGIWMKIPCRQGDTVYEIDGITWKGHDWKYRSYESAFVKETVFRLEMLSEIGKTVFLTKEEAEQALERMEGEHE